MTTIKIKKQSATDILMGIFVVVLLAFRDYASSVILLSVIVFAWLLSNKLMARGIGNEVVEFSILKVLFIVLCLFSSLWSPNHTIVYLCISMAFRLIICLCVLLYINNEENLIKTLKFLVLGSIVLCVRMIIVIPPDAWGNSRVGLYLAHDPDNSYGNTGITYVLGIVSSIIIADINCTVVNKKWKKLFIVLFTLLSLMSGSKKQIFILLIAYFTVLVLSAANPVKLLKNIFLYLIGTMVIFYLVFNIPVLYGAIGYRLESFFSFFGKHSSADTNDLSTISRLFFLKDAIKAFIEHPIIGVGIDSFKYYNSYQFSWAECNYLELLADVGIIGFIMYYLPHMCIINMMNVVKRSKNSIDLMMRVLFTVLMFVDLTMVSYNEAHLQLYLAIVYSYYMIHKNIRKARNE